MKTKTQFFKVSMAACCMLMFSVNLSFGQANHLVISQIYGGGGNSGSYWRQDFIELYNGTSDTVFLTGWSVQYASATGSFGTIKSDLTGLIAPGRYFLIQEAQGTGGITDLPSPDMIFTGINAISMSSQNGKVALCNKTSFLTGSCPVGDSIVDFVGYGTAGCYEGPAATAALSNTTSGSRLNKGCIDTDNNGADFTIGTVYPRNSLTLAWFCAEKKLFISSVLPATPYATDPIDIIVYSLNGSGIRTDVVYPTTLSLTSNDSAGTIGGTVTGIIPAGSDSVVISGITFPLPGPDVVIIATPSSGDYLVADTSNPFDVYVATGINDNEGQNSLSVYKNNTGLVVLFRLMEAADASIQIYDITGRLIHNTAVADAHNNKVEINTAGWRSGIYLISVTTETEIFSYKISL